MAPQINLPTGTVNKFRVVASDENTNIYSSFENQFNQQHHEQVTDFETDHEDHEQEDSDSETDHEDKESSVSDCESVVAGPNRSEFQSYGEELVKVNEEEIIYNTITRRLNLGLGNFGLVIKVEAIHRNSFSGFTYQARIHSFRLFQRAMERNNGGDANIKYVWFGASKDDIKKILSHGFGHCSQAPETNLSYGSGVYLSPVDSPLESVESAVEDDDGLRYLLLCRVLLGRVELVLPGSQQSHPSSSEFDSGVDNLESPKKYIIWGTQMNTHILPEFVITFTAQPCSRGIHRIQVPMRKPTSSWMPFPTLISTLAKVLPPDAISLIVKHHHDNRANKISRHELIQRVRQIAGDKLLATVVRSYRDKYLEATGYSPSKYQQRQGRISTWRQKD